MKIKVLIVLILIVGLALSYIGTKQKAEPLKIVARINDFHMTVDDLKDKMKHSPYSRESAVNLEEFLDLAIREQVLIQEAQHRGLDREKEFMGTIERYWAQTLIRELINDQSRRIYDSVPKDKREEEMEKWLEALQRSADIRIYEEVLNEIK